jgi:predicted SAM-dependent methyltransferase
VTSHPTKRVHVQKLNLGCGPIHAEGWINVDGSRRAWVSANLPWMNRLLTRLRVWPPTEFSGQTHYANLLKRLPWSDNSVDCVYMGEVLEHFTQDDGRRLLAECFRILRPGGILRLRVPDNARFWRAYLQEYDAIHSRPRSEWTDAHSRWVEMFFRDICVRRSSWGSFGHFHKYMYDEVSLIRAFEAAGFVEVSRRAFLDSAVPEVKAVETHEDLTVEGRKPGAAT